MRHKLGYLIQFHFSPFQPHQIRVDGAERRWTRDRRATVSSPTPLSGTLAPVCPPLLSATPALVTPLLVKLETGEPHHPLNEAEAGRVNARRTGGGAETDGHRDQ